MDSSLDFVGHLLPTSYTLK